MAQRLVSAQRMVGVGLGTGTKMDQRRVRLRAAAQTRLHRELRVAAVVLLERPVVGGVVPALALDHLGSERTANERRAARRDGESAHEYGSCRPAARRCLSLTFRAPRPATFSKIAPSSTTVEDSGAVGAAAAAAAAVPCSVGGGTCIAIAARFCALSLCKREWSPSARACARGLEPMMAMVARWWRGGGAG